MMCLQKSIPHRNVTDHVAMLTLTDSSQPFDGDAFKSEASLKFVPQTHAVDQSNVPVAGVTHGSPTKPPNHFAWPIQQGLSVLSVMHQQISIKLFFCSQ